jgi:hypothetical protein
VSWTTKVFTLTSERAGPVSAAHARPCQVTNICGGRNSHRYFTSLSDGGDGGVVVVVLVVATTVVLVVVPGGWLANAAATTCGVGGSGLKKPACNRNHFPHVYLLQHR